MTLVKETTMICFVSRLKTNQSINKKSISYGICGVICMSNVNKKLRISAQKKLFGPVRIKIGEKNSKIQRNHYQ